MNTNSITITIPNPTSVQMEAIAAIMGAAPVGGVRVGSASDSPLAGISRAKRGASKRAAPLKTVSPDEDEDYGTEAIDEDELDVASDEDLDVEADEDEEESRVTFDMVKAAINKYGDKKPDAMKAILTGFNLKGTKELERTKSKWQPVYDKVMAKLQALKKAR